MKTSATNKKIHELMVSIRNETLVPNPEFQRRLVWANKHKIAFLETVLGGFPFPEIYIAAGELDPDTGESKTLLVDGQQRITTLYQYFTGSPEIKLSNKLPLYTSLTNDDKFRFLEYEVVVRDLGKKSQKEIVEIFKRINSTNYALNSMEIHHAVYNGPYMRTAELLSKSLFFNNFHIFSSVEIKRSKDVLFVLTCITTMLSVYFNRDTEIESYLSRYNEDFPQRDIVTTQFKSVIKFIEDCNLGEKSRAWQKADLLTLLVEAHRVLFKDDKNLDPLRVRESLIKFYELVDNRIYDDNANVNVKSYYSTIIQGSNDRSNRITRGRIIREIITNNHIPENIII